MTAPTAVPPFPPPFLGDPASGPRPKSETQTAPATRPGGTISWDVHSPLSALYRTLGDHPPGPRFRISAGVIYIYIHIHRAEFIKNKLNILNTNKLLSQTNICMGPTAFPPSFPLHEHGTATRRHTRRSIFYRKPTDYSNQITTGQTETHAFSAVQHVFV